VDDGIHSAQGIYLVCHGPGFRRGAQIADDNACCICAKVGEGRCAYGCPCMKEDFVALVYEGARSGAAEPVGGTGDENSCH
jgi:hypothetical protein